MTSDVQSPTYHHHLFPREFFDELARGRGDSASIRLMRKAERSRRLLLFRVLLDEVARRPEALGPMPPVETAYRALVDAECQDSVATAEVILSPQFGIWLSRAIRLLRGRAATALPLWVEIGYLHAAAFAATVRSKGELLTQVPVVDGRSMLPTLGMAYFSSGRACEVADATVSAPTGVRLKTEVGEEVILPGDRSADGEGWWALREIAVSAGNRTLCVRLDDLDPYRDLSDPVPPDRLAARTFRHWRDHLDEAWRIVDASCPDVAAAMSTGLDSIAPLPRGPGRGIRSSSTGEGFGAALISPPSDAVSLALSLVHEFQHIKLGGVLHLVALLDKHADSQLTYAPWRDDPRPLSGLLQGIYAFFGMSRFWQRYRRTVDGAEHARGNFEFAYARRQVRRAMRTLRNSPHLTELGREFVGVLEETIGGQRFDPVGPGASRAAWAAAFDHEVIWRIRNLQPDPLGVERLTSAFLSGAPARGVRLVGSRLVPDPAESWPHDRITLHRMTFDGRDGLRAADGDGRLKTWLRGITKADVALVMGETEKAERTYTGMLMADPANIGVWPGYALALAANRSTSAWRAIGHRPELIRAVYMAVRGQHSPLSPKVVAEWLHEAPAASASVAY